MGHEFGSDHTPLTDAQAISYLHAPGHTPGPTVRCKACKKLWYEDSFARHLSLSDECRDEHLELIRWRRSDGEVEIVYDSLYAYSDDAMLVAVVSCVDIHGEWFVLYATGKRVNAEKWLRRLKRTRKIAKNSQANHFYEMRNDPSLDKFRNLIRSKGWGVDSRRRKLRALSASGKPKS